jgi:hypothetical protein
MSEKWLRCRVYKGMFSDELAIRYVSRDGNCPVAVFVPKGLVEGKIDEEGRVKVTAFHQGNSAWAVLPSDQQLVIPVDDADLVAL